MKLRTATTTLLTLLLALPGLALADGGSGQAVQLANVDASGSRIFFEPLVQFQALKLTVTGPYDFHFEQTVTKGAPVFELQGSEIDGCYSFELFLTPVIDPAYLEALDEARQSGDMSQVIALQMAGKLPNEQITQTGTFNIERGAIVLGGATEEKALELPVKNETPKEPGIGLTPKQTIAESLCVGFDCPASPSFSFTTLLMMENNLRIKFDDTSTAASFPNRDWSLNANDSANGGASRFWIQDCGVSSQGGCSGNAVFSIAAGARNNALFIDSQGDLGLGTSTPVVEIHAVSGDSPGLRLEQNTSSGFAAQTWDIVGNETSFFVRDATNGSTLPFRIRPGAASNSLVVDTDDDVGVGILSPTSPLHVFRSTSGAKDMLHLENNGPSRFLLENTNANSEWRFNADDSDDLRIAENITNADIEFILTETGNLTITGTLTENSDVNAKEAFEAVNGQEILTRVLDLPITSWKYKNDPATVRHIGPMAQDFYAAFGFGGTDRGIAPRNMSGIALVAIQGLYEQLQTKQGEVETLAARVAALESLVRSLQSP